MAEWLNVTVSKTVVRASVPWVRIPPSPHRNTLHNQGFLQLATARCIDEFTAHLEERIPMAVGVSGINSDGTSLPVSSFRDMLHG